jgi:hypothetical protein
MKLMIRILLIVFFGMNAASLCGQSTQIQYLSGTGNDNMVNWEFFCTAGRNSGTWGTIGVPSCWELQGYGKYDYGFAKDSLRGKEKGMYKYAFKVPASWSGKVVRIVFEGSMTDTEVKINGVSAGPIHQGAFYAFKYDISKLLKYSGTNQLEVTVSKHSANTSVNAAERKADFWIFGGIFRPVFLEALPQQYIDHVAINASAKGQLTANVYLGGNNKSGQLSAQLFTADGKKAGAPFITSVAANAKLATLKTTIALPKLWSPEFPHLYKLQLTYIQDGKPLHAIEQKTGFRTVEVKPRDGIYVNDVKVKMKGVNRHSFWPTSGRTLSKKLSIEDVTLMKDMNMNAVRMSHYPPDGHFLDVCDSLGLFVMDELAGWHGHYDTPTGTVLLKDMLEHDVNHPSVVIWSNGNEGGHNFDLDHLFTEWDIQQRPVVHPWQLFGGIETQHYREYNYGIGNYEYGRDILLPTEFLHGLYDGGHGAGLEDYWEAMWHNPLVAGGFLWDFADEGVVRKDKNDSIDTDGNRGADGIIGAFHEKEGSYYAIKEIWSPVHVEKRYITPTFDGGLTIENRYHYTNINQCTFTYRFEFLNGVGPALKGSIVAPSIKPLEKGTLQIKLPVSWHDYDVLYVTATDPHGKELFTWSFPVHTPFDLHRILLPVSNKADPAVQLAEEDSVYTVTASKMVFTIHKRTGMLQQVKTDRGIIPFNNGPILQEAVNNFKNFTHRVQDGAIVIESAFDRKNSYNTLQWTISRDGTVKMEVHYFPEAYFTNFVGVNFSFPEKEMKGIAYMGDGPYRVWKNRMRGNKFGVWKKDYNATETGEYPIVYPEFKGYHSNMYWCRFITNQQSFRVYTDNENLFFRLFTPAFKTDQWKNYEIVFPNGDISFMQGIGAIGSKTQRAETTGPMGMKNVFYDYEKDPGRALKIVLYFDFRQ